MKKTGHRFGKEDREVNETDVKGGKQGNSNNKWKKYTMKYTRGRDRGWMDRPGNRIRGGWGVAGQTESD